MATPVVPIAPGRRFVTASGPDDVSPPTRKRRFARPGRLQSAGEPPMNLVQAYLRTIRDKRS